MDKRIGTAWLVGAVLAAVPSSGCAIINQGEVGVLRRWGALDPTPLQPGLTVYEPISTQVLLVPTRITTVTVNFVLPSKEGLNIDTTISILYRVDPAKAAEILGTIGERFEDDLVVAVFRSAAADVSAHFFARDLYSAERGRIERDIRERMSEVLSARGFIVENVLMKSIVLPPGLARSIEVKLQAEQAAEQMQFVIQREKLEAERKRIEAEGFRDSQRIVAEGLTEPVLRMQSIEAFKQLSQSPATKVIVTDGKSPFLLTDERGPSAPAPAPVPAPTRPGR